MSDFALDAMWNPEASQDDVIQEERNEKNEIINQNVENNMDDNNPEEVLNLNPDQNFGSEQIYRQQPDSMNDDGDDGGDEIYYNQDQNNPQRQDNYQLYELEPEEMINELPENNFNEKNVQNLDQNFDDENRNHYFRDNQQNDNENENDFFESSSLVADSFNQSLYMSQASSIYEPEHGRYSNTIGGGVSNQQNIPKNGNFRSPDFVYGDEKERQNQNYFDEKSYQKHLNLNEKNNQSFDYQQNYGLESQLSNNSSDFQLMTADNSSHGDFSLLSSNDNIPMSIASENLQNFDPENHNEQNNEQNDNKNENYSKFPLYNLPQQKSDEYLLSSMSLSDSHDGDVIIGKTITSPSPNDDQNEPKNDQSDQSDQNNFFETHSVKSAKSEEYPIDQSHEHILYQSSLSKNLHSQHFEPQQSNTSGGKKKNKKNKNNQQKNKNQQNNNQINTPSSTQSTNSLAKSTATNITSASGKTDSWALVSDYDSTISTITTTPQKMNQNDENDENDENEKNKSHNDDVRSIFSPPLHTPKIDTSDAISEAFHTMNDIEDDVFDQQAYTNNQKNIVGDNVGQNSTQIHPTVPHDGDHQTSIEGSINQNSIGINPELSVIAPSVTPSKKMYVFVPKFATKNTNGTNGDQNDGNEQNENDGFMNTVDRDGDYMIDYDLDDKNVQNVQNVQNNDKNNRKSLPAVAHRENNINNMNNQRSNRKSEAFVHSKHNGDNRGEFYEDLDVDLIGEYDDDEFSPKHIGNIKNIENIGNIENNNTISRLSFDHLKEQIDNSSPGPYTPANTPIKSTVISNGSNGSSKKGTKFAIKPSATKTNKNGEENDAIFVDKNEKTQKSQKDIPSHHNIDKFSLNDHDSGDNVLGTPVKDKTGQGLEKDEKNGEKIQKKEKFHHLHPSNELLKTPVIIPYGAATDYTPPQMDEFVTPNIAVKHHAKWDQNFDNFDHFDEKSKKNNTSEQSWDEIGGSDILTSSIPVLTKDEALATPQLLSGSPDGQKADKNVQKGEQIEEISGDIFNQELLEDEDGEGSMVELSPRPIQTTTTTTTTPPAETKAHSGTHTPLITKQTQLLQLTPTKSTHLTHPATQNTQMSLSSSPPSNPLSQSTPNVKLGADAYNDQLGEYNIAKQPQFEGDNGEYDENDEDLSVSRHINGSKKIGNKIVEKNQNKDDENKNKSSISTPMVDIIQTTPQPPPQPQTTQLSMNNAPRPTSRPSSSTASRPSTPNPQQGTSSRPRTPNVPVTDDYVTVKGQEQVKIPAIDNDPMFKRPQTGQQTQLPPVDVDNVKAKGVLDTHVTGEDEDDGILGVLKPWLVPVIGAAVAVVGVVGYGFWQNKKDYERKQRDENFRRRQ